MTLATGAAQAAAREGAAHESRQWVRLTRGCNNRCGFCLDAGAHDGSRRDPEAVREDLVEGRRRGATRLILSGGEPTIHPRFVDFVTLGRRLGYERVQTITNGRMFSYPEFLRRSVEAGLGEVTFSVHGPDAGVHDALVGVPGAFEQTLAGLRAALADGRVVVNVDVVVQRGNVARLAELLGALTDLGVREFDLLQVVPFGRAWSRGGEGLSYDVEAHREHLAEALAFSLRPGVHVWTNRFPPAWLEGFEGLIQDPHKLLDEVRGRRAELSRLLDEGVPLDCREPARCGQCHLRALCDALDEARVALSVGRFDVVRVEAGGRGAGADGRPRLPVVGSGGRPSARPLEARVAEARPSVLWVRAPDVTAARAVIERFEVPSLWLELDDPTGLASALSPEGTLLGRAVASVWARTGPHAEALLALPHGFEVRVALSVDTAPWLLSLTSLPPGMVLSQPRHARLSEALARDVDLAGFFRAFSLPAPVEGLPACVTGRAPRRLPAVLDAGTLDPEGLLDPIRFTERFIQSRDVTRSLRCGGCVHAQGCEGLSVNQVRAQGYRVMAPVRG